MGKRPNETDEERVDRKARKKAKKEKKSSGEKKKTKKAKKKENISENTYPNKAADDAPPTNVLVVDNIDIDNTCNNEKKNSGPCWNSFKEAPFEEPIQKALSANSLGLVLFNQKLGRRLCREKMLSPWQKLEVARHSDLFYLFSTISRQRISLEERQKQ